MRNYNLPEEHTFIGTPFGDVMYLPMNENALKKEGRRPGIEVFRTNRPGEQKIDENVIRRLGYEVCDAFLGNQRFIQSQQSMEEKVLHPGSVEELLKTIEQAS